MKVGDKVYLDVFAGLVPAIVVGIDGQRCELKLTATRGAYKRGEVSVHSCTDVVLRSQVYVKGGLYRIRNTAGLGTHTDNKHKMQIILPHPAPSREEDGASLAEWVSEWHGGQNTATYRLASIGSNNLVSLSMIDAAIDELEKIPSTAKYPEDVDRENLEALIGDLDLVRSSWKEFSAKEAGLESDPDFEYEYDE